METITISSNKKYVYNQESMFLISNMPQDQAMSKLQHSVYTGMVSYTLELTGMMNKFMN